MNYAAHTNTDSKLNHKFSKPVAVDQDHPLLKIFDIIVGLLAENASSHKDSLCCSKANKASDKTLNGRTANGLIRAVSLCLNIDAVKAEAIFINYAVDTAVA